MDLRERALTFSIEKAVPVLNRFRNTTKWPYELTQMRRFRTNTLGKEMAIFLDERELALLPKYEAHDALHVLLGYGTTPKEELKLQGFMLGNGSASFGGRILSILGLLIKPEYFGSFKVEYRRGKRAGSLRNINIESCLTTDLDLLRNELGLE